MAEEDAKVLAALRSGGQDAAAQLMLDWYFSSPQSSMDRLELNARFTRNLGSGSLDAYLAKRKDEKQAAKEKADREMLADEIAKAIAKHSR